MPRIARAAPGGGIYHVLNRSAGRMKLFRSDRDFAAFARVMAEAHERVPGLRILSYCVMSTHWHFVCWPRADDDVTAFFRWLAHTHAMRWRVSHRTVGYGHLYQGRFKSFPVQPDEQHLRMVCRYVERNPLTAGLVQRAQDWRWSSLWVRREGSDAERSLLTPWPVDEPADWVARVNAPVTTKELARIQTSIQRGRPLGTDAWVQRTAHRLGLEHSIRPEGRPRKVKPTKN